LKKERKEHGNLLFPLELHLPLLLVQQIVRSKYLSGHDDFKKLGRRAAVLIFKCYAYIWECVDISTHNIKIDN